MGSAYEIEAQILISNDLGFLSEEKTTFLIEQIVPLIKILSKLKTNLK